MELFLDDKTSLIMLRTVARDASLRLVPAHRTSPAPLSVSPAKLNRLGVPRLLSYLRVPEERDLGILVPEGKDRIRAKGIDCHVCKHFRGEEPVRELVEDQHQTERPLIPDGVRAFVLSPENIVLGMAGRLQALVTKGKMTHERAELMLLKLCLELCGTYSHDPFDPHAGKVTYRVQPCMTCESLCSFLQEKGAEKGLRLVRMVAPLAYDLSGSPQESFMGPGLFGCSRLGGYGLCAFEANKPLDLSYARRQLIEDRTITPDFTLMGYDSVVEYLGSIHKEGKNPQIDHVRSLDYQTLGIREFSFAYDDVRTRADFERSASRLVAVLEAYDGPEARRRFDRLCKSSAFAKRQRTLFEVFRPWLR